MKNAGDYNKKAMPEPMLSNDTSSSDEISTPMFVKNILTSMVIIVAIISFYILIFHRF